MLKEVYFLTVNVCGPKGPGIIPLIGEVQATLWTELGVSVKLVSLVKLVSKVSKINKVSKVSKVPIRRELMTGESHTGAFLPTPKYLFFIVIKEKR